MDITKTSEKIKSTKNFNYETVSYCLFFGLCFLLFLLIKQVMKIMIGISASIAAPVAFGLVMLGLFLCEKKLVFTNNVKTKLTRQIISYLFMCAVDIGFYKILEFAIGDLLNLGKILPYFFSLILILVFNYYFSKLIVFDSTSKHSVNSDKKIYLTFYKNRFVILSMAIATACILFSFMIFKLFPFGDMTVLRMDLYHQYGPLFVEFFDRVTQFKSFLYSWESGGGSSFLGNYFNYLSSPLSFLIFLFDRDQIGYAISTLVVVKVVLSAGTFTYFLKKSFGSHSYASAAFGLFYAFNGYFLAYYWNIMWIDGMILLPLVSLGIENIINDRKCKTYIISLALLLFSTYYIGYMTCIFSIAYFLLYYFANYEASNSINPTIKNDSYINKVLNNRLINSGLKFAISSIIVGGICACFLIPVYFILQSCSATSDSFPSSIESAFNLFDMISSHLAGLETTIRSSGEDVLPNIYCSILAVILLPLYLINKEIRLKEKVAYMLMLLFFVISFDCNVVDFVWHAMHLPNDLPFRYSHMYVFIMLIVAFKSLMHIKGVSYRDIMITGIGVVMLVMLYQKFPTNKIFEFTIYVSIAFTMVWTLVLLLIKKKYMSKLILGAIVISIAFCEVIVADSNSYVFTQNQKSYVDRMETMENANNLIASQDNGLYRTEQTYLDTRMDPCLYEYNGMSTFSSMAYEDFSQTQYNLGLYGNRINSYTYNTQTPVYNMLYGIKYLIKSPVSLNPDTYYTKIGKASDGKTEIYKNNYCLPIAFVASSEANNWNNVEGNPFDVQESLIDTLAGVSNVFIPVDYISSESNDVICEDVVCNGPYFVDGINNSGSIDINVKCVKDGNLFVYITSSDIENVNYFWNDGNEDTYQNIETPYIMDLGNHKASDEVRISLDLNGIEASSTSFSIYAYNLDEETLKSAYDILNLGGLDITNYSDTEIEGTLNAGYDGYLYTSIPFDEGWAIYIDGEKVKTFELGDSQLCATIKHGEHNIKLKYKPKGLKIGFTISIFTVLILAIVTFIDKKNILNNIANKRKE